MDARLVNDRLFAAHRRLPPIPVRGCRLQVVFAHVGAGPYAAGAASQPHRHQDLQIEAVHSGRFIFTGADDREMAVGAGDALLIPPGHPHAWRCAETGVMLGCDVAVAGGARAEWLRLPPWTCSAAGGELAALLDAAAAGDRLAPRRAGAGFEAWILRLLAALSDEDDSARADRADRLCACAESYIAANLESRLRAEDVALHVGVSLRHLDRLFRARHGHAVGESLRRARLDRAAELLGSEPGLSVQAVARRCGINSASHFALAFRRRFGRAPGHREAVEV